MCHLVARHRVLTATDGQAGRILHRAFSGDVSAQRGSKHACAATGAVQAAMLRTDSTHLKEQAAERAASAMQAYRGIVWRNSQGLGYLTQ